MPLSQMLHAWAPRIQVQMPWSTFCFVLFVSDSYTVSFVPWKRKNFFAVEAKPFITRSQNSSIWTLFLEFHLLKVHNKNKCPSFKLYSWNFNFFFSNCKKKSSSFFSFPNTILWYSVSSVWHICPPPFSHSSIREQCFPFENDVCLPHTSPSKTHLEWTLAQFGVSNEPIRHSRLAQICLRCSLSFWKWYVCRRHVTPSPLLWLTDWHGGFWRKLCTCIQKDYTHLVQPGLLQWNQQSLDALTTNGQALFLFTPNKR